MEDPNKKKAQQFRPGDVPPRVSLGDPANTEVKKDGIKIRGTGAATKGVKARGPMA